MTTYINDEAILKSIALAIHNEEDFFVCDGIAYMGNEEEAKEAHQEHCQHIDKQYPFSEWLESEGITMPDYEEDNYMVLTDDEANDKAGDYIKDSLWAFNPSFLSGETGIDSSVFEAIQSNGKCEDNNDAVASCINDMWSFVESAISADGRGHFLNTYDGDESEINVKDYSGENQYYYVYRIN
jgi:hypothetical protein